MRLTPHEYDEFQMVGGRLAKNQLDELVASPGWYSMPDYARKEVIENVIKQARQAAESLIQMRYPELIQEGVELRTKQIQGASPQ